MQVTGGQYDLALRREHGGRKMERLAGHNRWMTRAFGDKVAEVHGMSAPQRTEHHMVFRKTSQELKCHAATED